MNRRIPTLLGIFILLAGLIAGVVLVNMRQGVESKAGPAESPKNVKISNLGSATFSISWTTDTPLTGLVKYSEDPTKINTPAGDIRDQISGTSQSYNNHAVNVTGLKASTTYYFLIVSGSGTYDDGGKPFQARTTAQAIAPPEDIIYGKILKETGESASGAIVFVEAEGGQSLSAISGNDGGWRLNLANSRDKSGKILTYDPAKTLLSIFVRANNNATATALTDTSKDKPVPDIVLGRNQTFVETAAPLTGIEPTTENAGAGFQLEADVIALSEQLEATSSVKVLNPATNGEIIATDKPEFRGKAPTGTSVKLTVQSIVMVEVVIADADGNWKWTPPNKLETGLHTLTVEYTDTNNQVQKIVRTFTVMLGGQPAFTATPSATPTATASAGTPTPTSVMPDTSTDTLTDAGALEMSMGLTLLGVGLIIAGRIFKKRWQ